MYLSLNDFYFIKINYNSIDICEVFNICNIYFIKRFKIYVNFGILYLKHYLTSIKFTVVTGN